MSLFQSPTTPSEHSHTSARRERSLRILVGFSSLGACVVLWLLVDRHQAPSRLPLPQPPGPEERIDSLTLSRIESMRSISSGRLHRVIAILDPSTRDASTVASALTDLAGESALHVSVTLFLATQRGQNSSLVMNDILAGHCAQRQGRLVEFLQAIDKRNAPRNVGWTALAVASSIGKPAAFVECVFRRDAAENVIDGQFLVHKLRLYTLPAILIDSTVIRGRISVDSVRSRLVVLQR